MRRGQRNSRLVELGSGLPRSFYHRPTLEVAQDLLGLTLRVVAADGTTSGFIVETEAYLGRGDEASHAHRGPTPRSRLMFEAPGVLYVYFIYGAHYCVNTVAHDADTAGAVLIRAVQPWQGLTTMARRRGVVPSGGGVWPECLSPEQVLEGVPRSWRTLTNGPGKLTQALAIGPHHNGLDLEEGAIHIGQTRTTLAPFSVDVSRRIGIRRSVDLPYRFTVRSNAFLSHP